MLGILPGHRTRTPFQAVSENEEEVLIRAYPLIPERMLGDSKGFDYENPTRGDTPLDWHRCTRFVLHRCMRVAYEARESWLVEVLEEYREHEAAQLAFAYADYRERYPERRGS